MKGWLDKSDWKRVNRKCMLKQAVFYRGYTVYIAIYISRFLHTLYPLYGIPTKDTHSCFVINGVHLNFKRNGFR